MDDENQHQRIFEIIPGALVWLTFVFAIVLSFIRPLWVMVLVIVFDLYWLFRIFYFVFYLLLAWKNYRRDIRTDWFARAVATPGALDIYHVVFLPTFRENLSVIQSTLRELGKSHYPVRKLIVVLAGEEADHDRFAANARAVQEEFGARFGALIVTEHPQDLADEISGKGSNLHYAGPIAKKYLDDAGILYGQVVASAFDVDTLVHPDYFACLSVKFCTEPDAQKSSYQPIALYNNNMWQSAAAVRVASFGTTFWLLSELVRPDRMMTFSSHSMPFQMLVDVGFWQNDVVSEDSRIFIQGLLQYDGAYRVTPIFLPVSMDAVAGDSYVASLRALYRQQRRWAWGVEHFPFLLTEFRKHPRMPRMVKFRHVWHHLEGMYTWATVPVLIFLLGHLPLWVAPRTLREQAFFINTPETLSVIMTVTMVGIFISAALSLLLLPPRPRGSRWHAPLLMIAQWALLPVTFVLFGSLPAIDAQTRLMLGKYLGFNVSQKRKI